MRLRTYNTDNSLLQLSHLPTKIVTASELLAATSRPPNCPTTSLRPPSLSSRHTQRLIQNAITMSPRSAEKRIDPYVEPEPDKDKGVVMGGAESGTKTDTEHEREREGGEERTREKRSTRAANSLAETRARGRVPLFASSYNARSSRRPSSQRRDLRFACG